jgi:hypothetical protein
MSSSIVTCLPMGVKSTPDWEPLITENWMKSTKKTTTTNQWVQQDCAIQNQHTKSVVFYILEMNKWKLKLNNIPFVIA